MAHDESKQSRDALLPETDLGESARAKLSDSGFLFSPRLLLLGVLISLGVHTFCLPFLLSVTVLFAPQLVSLADRLPNYTVPHEDAPWQLQLNAPASHDERTVTSGDARAIVKSPSVSSVLAIAKTEVLRLEEAEYWDLIGTYQLNDQGGNPVSVELYVFDTAVRPQKQYSRGDRVITVTVDGDRSSFHAIYHDQSGQWKHRKLHETAYQGFCSTRVQKVSPDAIVLEFRWGSLAYLRFNAQGESLDSIEEMQRKIAAAAARQQHITLTLSLDQGVPVIKAEYPQ